MILLDDIPVDTAATQDVVTVGVIVCVLITVAWFSWWKTHNK